MKINNDAGVLLVQKKLDHFINTSVQLLVLIVVVSNVIEDMLIVIGFNSKQIKQIKLGDLVHKSQDKKNLTNSQVFKNS
ncbi:structural maintenance of chromosome protein [Tieghemostelium lacteum]|uniref:Structural maintenance of chromosome protein n=1 Tax=Tieghemostelium lacteum TaxID=361077 RepID=A0A151ZD75_TIELA|nr:structural maintenance of chromosome protein [Tieghemostelium lacteum]|eukprot:KYQ91897.1 structural maintenance of chromosome protein [Tieghemostelium lacteum]